MKVVSFIGTSDEFKSVAHLFLGGQEAASLEGAPEIAPEVEGSSNFAAITRVLKRIPISPGQKALYQALYNAGSDGLMQKELAQKIDRTEQELSGILGALGRRINGTDGIVIQEDELAISVFFDVEWIDDEWHYTMKPILRKALEKEGVIGDSTK
jgi:hypothetical protein